MIDVLVVEQGVVSKMKRSEKKEVRVRQKRCTHSFFFSHPRLFSSRSREKISIAAPVTHTCFHFPRWTLINIIITIVLKATSRRRIRRRWRSWRRIFWTVFSSFSLSWTLFFFSLFLSLSPRIFIFVQQQNDRLIAKASLPLSAFSEGPNENTHRVSHVAGLPLMLTANDWQAAVAVLATNEQHQHQLQDQQQGQKKTTSPREKEEEEREGLRKKMKKKRKKNEREKDGNNDDEEDEIEKVDAATLAANMKKVPLIEKDARGGGDPNFHGLKEGGEGQEQEPKEERVHHHHHHHHQQQQQQEKEATPPHSSRFRGVTKHKRSGRWEAHIWIRDSKKQVYLGGYSNEQHAAEAFDLVAMKCKLMKNGRKIKLNYPASKYQDLQGYLLSTSLEELIMAVRRQSQGFARGSSGYRGVTLHPTGRWEARIGLPGGKKHVYLGLFETEVEAARAYDVKLVELRGPSMATNFAMSNYAKSIKIFYEENPDAANESTESTPSTKEAKFKTKKKKSSSH